MINLSPYLWLLLNMFRSVFGPNWL
jgi:hypothetical protein